MRVARLFYHVPQYGLRAIMTRGINNSLQDRYPHTGLDSTETGSSQQSFPTSHQLDRPPTVAIIEFTSTFFPTRQSSLNSNSVSGRKIKQWVDPPYRNVPSSSPFLTF